MPRNVAPAPVYIGHLPQRKQPVAARTPPPVWKRTFASSNGVSTSVRAVPAATPPTITEGGRLVNGIGAVSAAMPLVSHARRAPAFAEKSADFWTPVLATMGTMPRKRPAIPSARTTCLATLPMDCDAKRDSACIFVFSVSNGCDELHDGDRARRHRARGHMECRPEHTNRKVASTSSSASTRTVAADGGVRAPTPLALSDMVGDDARSDPTHWIGLTRTTTRSVVVPTLASRVSVCRDAPSQPAAAVVDVCRQSRRRRSPSTSRSTRAPREGLAGGDGDGDDGALAHWFPSMSTLLTTVITERRRHGR